MAAFPLRPKFGPFGIPPPSTRDLICPADPFQRKHNSVIECSIEAG